MSESTMSLWKLAVAAGLLCAGVTAQINTGRMMGTVGDASGAVIPDARVTATNDATGAMTPTQSTESRFDVFSGVSLLNNGQGNRANRICNGAISNPTPNMWFNHTNFAAPDSGVGDATIGQVFSTSVDQRRMQFGLRLHF